MGIGGILTVNTKTGAVKIAITDPEPTTDPASQAVHHSDGAAAYTANRPPVATPAAYPLNS